MKLSRDAIIASDKLTRYLLVKRAIGDKSEFLKKAGYTIECWKGLEDDLRALVLSQDAISIERTGYGELFEICASLTGPTGVTLDLRTIWMREAGSGVTKFITLYPNKEKGRA